MSTDTERHIRGGTSAQEKSMRVRSTAIAAFLLASTSAWAQTADRIWSGGTILTM
jgi:hypothetical protein